MHVYAVVDLCCGLPVLRESLQWHDLPLRCLLSASTTNASRTFKTVVSVRLNCKTCLYFGFAEKCALHMFFHAYWCFVMFSNVFHAFRCFSMLFHTIPCLSMFFHVFDALWCCSILFDALRRCGKCLSMRFEPCPCHYGCSRWFSRSIWFFLMLATLFDASPCLYDCYWCCWMRSHVFRCFILVWCGLIRFDAFWCFSKYFVWCFLMLLGACILLVIAFWNYLTWGRFIWAGKHDGILTFDWILVGFWYAQYKLCGDLAGIKPITICVTHRFKMALQLWRGSST